MGQSLSEAKQAKRAEAASGCEPRSIQRRRSFVVVIGSAFLWSWGFLCFLSPVMFPPDAALDASIGIEIGFFVSQASVVAFALCVMALSRRRRLVVRRSAFFVAAVAISLSAVGIAWAVRANAMGVVIACGIVDGVCVTLLGVAWGARYSLGPKRIRPLVVLSFLVAYLLYLVVPHLPGPVPIACVCLLPVASWALWRNDATIRHEVASEVFPVRASDKGPGSLGELAAGSWEASVLPWRSLSVLLIATFIGNLITSVLLGRGYAGVDSLFFGGIVVCACIATMALVPLTSGRTTLSVGSVYRITVTFTAIGLVAIMVFGVAGVAVGGALVQGSAFFLQVLVFLVVTQSTQESGLSPLLSFSIGQAVISGVVFLGNVLGKQIGDLFGSGAFVLDVLCGASVLVLFFMLVARASAYSDGEMSQRGALADNEVETRVSPQGEAASRVEAALQPATSEELMVGKIASFAEAHGLTHRETEVFGYLARGRSLPYIAGELFVTTGTVKTHTTHIYQKLGVNSKQDLLDMFDSWGSQA